jgi:Tol biopolymer transport system component
VAFTSTSGGAGEQSARSGVWVRDARAETTTAISGRGWASDPAVSADGRFVAFVRRPLRGRRPHPERASLWLHDRVTGRTVLVSRRDGRAGGAADGASFDPAVSADGRRVAFTSTAGNLARGKPGEIAGVFVRDLAAGTTRLLSTHAKLAAAPSPREREAHGEGHDGHDGHG